MFFTEWHVLLVDDEPDVLSVSKLAMRNFEVYGVPLKLHTAQSKAEAIQLLGNMFELPALAVAFIDVVMENDTAGLELCQHIRQKMRNNLTQLFIRTGQPGVAPERKVIDNYDINGYFTKVEATEDKLYSLIKSGVRQYFWARMSMMASMILSNMIELRDSRAKMTQGLQGMFTRFSASFGNPTACWMIDKKVVAGVNFNAADAEAVRDTLDKLDGMTLGPNGDKFAEDGTNLLLKVAAQDGGSEACLIARTTFLPPQPIRLLLLQVLKGLSRLWYAAS